MSHRPTICGTRHAVSAGHYLAAAAGFTILEAGGNAIDAGCAAGIALGVLQPDLVNVAGVAPIMHPPRRRHGREHRRPRLVAEGVPRRPVHARARRQNPRRRAAHRDPRRARRLDHRAAPPRHDALRRGRRAGDPFRRRGVLGLSAAGHLDRLARARISPLAVQHRDLPAERPRAEGRRQIRADRLWRGRCSSWPIRTAPPAPIGMAGLQAAHDAFYRGDIAREIVRSSNRKAATWRRRTWPNTIPDRTGGAPALARPRTDHLRPLVPGPGAAAGAGAGRAGRHRRAGAQLARLSASHRRVPEPGDGGPRIFLRRSGFRRCAGRSSAGPATVARRAAAVRDDRAFGHVHLLGSAYCSWLYYKIAASEPFSYSWNISSQFAAGVMGDWRGVSGSPIDTTSGTTAVGNPAVSGAPSLTPIGSGELQVYFYAGPKLRAPVISQPGAIMSLANDPSSKEGFTLAFGQLAAPFGGVPSPVYNASATGSGPVVMTAQAVLLIP